MAFNQPFHQPWEEIDPELTHGGIPGQLAGQFVAPRLGDNVLTNNSDVGTVFGVYRDACANLSMHPEGHHQGPPSRNVLEEVLTALNWCMERVIDRTKTAATAMFQYTHATPPPQPFGLAPIRWPLRNDFLNQVIFHMLGAQVEVAESNANGVHSSLDPKSCQIILAPLWHVKANIMKDYFDVEVAGEITLDELQMIFEGVVHPGPTITRPSDEATNPDSGRVAEALSGREVAQWFPTMENWTTYARKVTSQYKTNRIYQPEGANGTSEDVRPERLVLATSVPPVSVG